ncbi:uncharacterized protein K452DRAFT_288496 [Aplosporella prunicola CBS 121167]|uniref:Uncharacterized protein n=1 Tax=Aplosporella prunicola CBS 121167 TaxID=1176127 RepID=A0A6A6BD34_9PEZI|nr:uncharacterized protein K452DRAFT_288496 [Aplosporella prunicola CBS 121167]KAF2141124.1 hypothetical protein K452DRAFT_288496 [Aplosporella prunicola CBS 121167]
MTFCRTEGYFACAVVHSGLGAIAVVIEAKVPITCDFGLSRSLESTLGGVTFVM